jgi:hypothetical protein
MRHVSGLRTVRAIVLALVGLCLALAPLVAKGKLDYVEKFRSGKDELAVATYADTDGAGAVKIVGLLGFASGNTRNSFAFNHDEWDSFLQLWAKAVKAQTSAPGNAWKFVGNMTESGTTDVSQLTVSAGAGVKFAVSSPNGASLSYILLKPDHARFEKALLQVKPALSK